VGVTVTSPLTRPIIEFDRVTFAYQNGEEIFRDVNFKVPKGGFYFVTGESGSGKSTLLKLIYNANKSYLGSLKVLDQEMKTLKDPARTQLRRKIGIVFQEFHLFDHLTVLDNVALPLTLAGKSLAVAREQAAEMLSWLGLGSFLHQMPILLSGGQRQRIAVARAAVGNPDIILADEPTGHVDDNNAVKLMFLFTRLYEQGKTILFATHNRDLISEFPFPELSIAQKHITLHGVMKPTLREVTHV
jgi:cell division transport system ATP-binding protein